MEKSKRVRAVNKNEELLEAIVKEHVCWVVWKYQNRERSAKALGISSRTLSNFRLKWGYKNFKSLKKHVNRLRFTLEE